MLLGYIDQQGRAQYKTVRERETEDINDACSADGGLLLSGCGARVMLTTLIELQPSLATQNTANTLTGMHNLYYYFDIGLHNSFITEVYNMHKVVVLLRYEFCHNIYRSE